MMTSREGLDCSQRRWCLRVIHTCPLMHTHTDTHTPICIHTDTYKENQLQQKKNNWKKEYESVDIKRTIRCCVKFCYVTSSNHHRWHFCVWRWMCCYCVCCCFSETSKRNRALSLCALLSSPSHAARTKPKNWKNSITATKCPLSLTRKQLARVCCWNNQANPAWLESTDDLLYAFVLFLFVCLLFVVAKNLGSHCQAFI